MRNREIKIGFECSACKQYTWKQKRSMNERKECGKCTRARMKRIRLPFKRYDVTDKPKKLFTIENISVGQAITYMVTML